MFFGDRSPAFTAPLVRRRIGGVSVESPRTLRRTAGFLVRFFSNVLFKPVNDPRSARGRRWKSAIALLETAALALAAGCKGLGEVEKLTNKMAPALRHLIAIARRVPDTTMRDFLCALNPHDICRLIWIAGYDAWRRKALHMLPDFPWGAASLDAKYPSVRDVGDGDDSCDPYLQVHHDPDTKQPHHGLIRVVTSVLITAVGRPIIGATPIPGATNEEGHFMQAFGDLVRIYGCLFRVVLYDAGAASLVNAEAVIKAGKDYFFQIADPRWIMYQTIDLLLRDVVPAARTEEVSGIKRVVRELTMRTVADTGKGLTLWRHTRTIFKVVSHTYENGVFKSTKVRFFVTSLAASELSADKWLKLIVLRWGVEVAHQILDCAFEEDKHPWITSNANGALVVMLLRRLVYTIMTLYKSVTLRAEDNQEMTWRDLMKQIEETLKWAQANAVECLRPRTFAVPPALA